MLLPSSHCALTFCNEVLSRGPFHTSWTTDSFFFVCYSPTFIFMLFYASFLSFLLSFRIEGGKGRGVKDGGTWQEVWLLTVQILSGTPASCIHHSLMLMAVAELHPSLHAQIIQPTPPPHPLPLHNPHPPLSQHGKRDLTQKWVETNDSNESLPPCQCLPSLPLPLQVAPNGSVFRLANCRSPSLNKYWEGKLLPEPSCEPYMLKSSQTQGLTNRFVSFIVFEIGTNLKPHWFQVHRTFLTVCEDGISDQ